MSEEHHPLCSGAHEPGEPCTGKLPEEGRAPHPKGTQPSHELLLGVRDSPAKNVVGVGWEDAGGSISLVLQPGIVLSWQDPVRLRLRPVDPAIREARALRAAERLPPSPPAPPAAPKARWGGVHLADRRVDGPEAEQAAQAVCGAKVPSSGYDMVDSTAEFFALPKKERCPSCAMWIKTNVPKKVHFAKPERVERPWECSVFPVSPENIAADPRKVTCRFCLAAPAFRKALAEATGLAAPPAPAPPEAPPPEGPRGPSEPAV